MRRAEEMLELVALGGLGARRPAELSGGQRQRVALARALINQPEVLLLDEPLGALDLKLRQQMQTELKALQRKVGITFVYVTHDQEEALGMSDRAGGVQPRPDRADRHARGDLRAPGDRVRRRLRRRLQHRRCAEPAERLTGRRQAFSLRPERIRIAPDGADACVEGTVARVQYHGASTRIEVALDGGRAC